MKLVDTGVFVAFFRQNDPLHERAVELLKKHSRETLICTSSVLQETLEMIRRHDEGKRALEVARNIFRSENLEMETHSEEELRTAAETLGRYANLSFCDALTVAAARRMGIREIISFDSDFDAFKDLRRLS